MYILKYVLKLYYMLSVTVCLFLTFCKETIIKTGETFAHLSNLRITLFYMHKGIQKYTCENSSSRTVIDYIIMFEIVSP
jgi:hypothetical protein